MANIKRCDHLLSNILNLYIKIKNCHTLDILYDLQAAEMYHQHFKTDYSLDDRCHSLDDRCHSLGDTCHSPANTNHSPVETYGVTPSYNY